MPPPLLLLQNIRLTFGTKPLLSGAALAVGADDRICLVGPGVEWLEGELAGTRSGIVLISHARRLLERFSRTTVWLDRGITRTLGQGFGAFEPWRDAILDQEETEQHKLSRKIAMEEDW